MVISDFLDPEGFEAGLNMLRYYKHDVFAVQVVAHEDVEPEVRGQIQLIDSESQVERQVTVTPELLKAYKSEVGRFSDAIRHHCLKYQLGYVHTVTNFPFEDLVLEVFRQGRFLK